MKPRSFYLEKYPAPGDTFLTGYWRCVNHEYNLHGEWMSYFDEIEPYAWRFSADGVLRKYQRRRIIWSTAYRLENIAERSVTLWVDRSQYEVDGTLSACYEDKSVVLFPFPDRIVVYSGDEGAEPRTPEDCIYRYTFEKG